jgi:HK97 family phage major capsid protein
MNNNTNHPELGSALNRVRKVAERAQAEGRGFTESEQAEVNTALADAKQVKNRLAADEARAQFAALLQPSDESQDTATIVGAALGVRSITPSTTGFARAEWSQQIVPSLDMPTFLDAIPNAVKHTITEPSLKVAVITDDYNAAVVAAGAAITAGDATTSLVTLNPYRVASLTEVAREVVEAMPNTALRAFGDSLITSVRRKVEDLALNGSGSSQPRGILNTQNAWGIALGGAMSNLDFIADAVEKVQRAGGQPTCIITSPAVVRELLQIKSATSGSNLPVIAANAMQPFANGATGLVLNGLPVIVSTSVPADGGASSNSSYLAVLDGGALHYAFQSPSSGGSPVELARSMDGSDYFAKDLIALRATARFDLAVANPLGLCIVSGITV